MSAESELASQTQVLRHELKQWEQNFAAANGGRKATRDEIKKDAVIAAKYKEYSRIRDAFSGNSISKPPSPKKRKTQTVEGIEKRAQRSSSRHAAAPAEPSEVRTPSRKQSRRHDARDRALHAVTPQRSHSHRLMSEIEGKESDEDADPLPAFIGPTPQKNGLVLGLFDLLSPVKRRTQTPLKSKTRATLSDINDGQNRRIITVSGTPKTDRYCASLLDGQEPVVIVDENDGTTINPDHGNAQTPGTQQRHSRTPQSAGKRYLLDSFVTPSKRRRLNDGGTPIAAGEPLVQGAPAIHHSISLATPAFLRRRVDAALLPSLAEDVEPLEDGSAAIPTDTIQSPIRRPSWLRRQSAPSQSFDRARKPGMTRSLSSMIADMRKTEEDRLDEEMDLLREMDGEVADYAPRVTGTRSRGWDQHVLADTETISQPVLVEDSQQIDAADLKLLGPDGDGGLSEDEETQKAGLGADGKPLRIWKKKGMKRQTRRVLMRPATRAKPLAQRSTSIQDLDSSTDDELTQPGIVDNVSETQPQGNDFGKEAEEDVDDQVLSDQDVDESGSDFEHRSNDNDSDVEDTGRSTAKRTARKVKSTTKITATGATTMSSTSTDRKMPTTKTQSTTHPLNAEPKEEGTLKKKIRKISATAHANFRRLKIKSSKGAKAGVGGGGGRFGGGRRFGRR